MHKPFLWLTVPINNSTTHDNKLTLVWDFVAEQDFSIDEYEISRKPLRHQRAMVLTGWARCEILRRSGIDDDAIVRGIQQAIVCRQQRRETIRRLRYQRWDEMEEFVKSMFVSTRQTRDQLQEP